ncbi:TRAP-type C4-dicarboxylate transport system, small permease component [Paracoccus halophilus]|uniref:TRAP transporter small permease protein n=1 Tax=Paracoccus halophilus TaxID=376733 RepID=A0A099EZC8_9RHOB|nr:TRAP transporter small permease [Paracoccus halophilus]KGJ03539.1 C4-dicarboxylate ABC transporter [Paracoccus halophilus]SFA57790.1 TRAP-type C4-dicarboxylate transport system, small permease component [Paracoccus halophilus]
MLKPVETAVARFSMVMGGLVLVLMMLQVVVDVFMRAFLGAGFPATPDLVGKYYMVAVSVLPLALTELKRRHIEATIFTQKLTGAPLKAVLLFGFLVFGAVLAVLLYGSFGEAMRQMDRGAYIEAGTMRFITWPSYWILPFSFGLALIVIAIRIIEVLTGQFRDGDHDPLDQVDAMREDA